MNPTPLRLAMTLLLALALWPVAPASAATLRTFGPDAMTSFTDARAERFLTEPREARFTRGTSETVWISDIEHVVWGETDERFLADDPTSPVVLARATIPAGHRFQLFPYHYMGEDEATTLGATPQYRLVVLNETTAPVTVEIGGIGTTVSWGHEHAWGPAMKGEGATTFTLAPGAVRTLWHEAKLKPGLPWSGVVLGRTSGDLTVADYCYLGEKDPGPGAPLMPDLAWPPHLLASFSRGCVDWFTADVDLLPEARDAKGDLPVGALPARVSSVAFGYSPGGPITNLCEYKVVQPTFLHDIMRVPDPLTGWDHVFFGGNYPAMYRFRLPLVNDTTAPVTLNFHLAANDRFGVHSTAGVWLEGRFHRAVTPAIVRGDRWRVWSVRLAPGQRHAVDMTVVALGGLWGGFVGSLSVD